MWWPLTSGRCAFDDDLRRLLLISSPGGRFCERTRDVSVVIWQPR